jgi:RNA polymerase sigma factor (sigma-70 family)
MKDYRVTVKVRNNRILKAIEETGGTPGGKWCMANGLPYQDVNSLITMTAGPLFSTGELRPVAVKLCDVLNKLPEELWSNEQLYPLEKNFSEMEMDHAQVVALLPSSEQSYMLDDSGIEQAQQRGALDRVIGTLTERQQKVLKLRYESELTLKETAEIIGVSYARVVQIEATALRLIRTHPQRAAALMDCLDLTPLERARIKAQERNSIQDRGSIFSEKEEA